MSQEKVNKYKEEKANRKQIIKKEKRNRIIGRIIGAIVCLAIVGWIGFSIYDSTSKSIASSQTEVDFTAVDDYFSAMNADDAVTDAEE